MSAIYSRHLTVTLPTLTVLAMLTATSAAADDFWRAVTGGKPDLHLRYRYEYADDGQLPVLEDAYANTLRTAVGYSTGLYHGFGAYAQIEDVRSIGNEQYDDGGSNGLTSHAAIVDPEDTEIHQANLRYRGLSRTQIWAGRQEIEHRGAPMHRYVGNILWRQNWQSFDGVRVVNESLPATKVDYAYIWNVNRIFGENNPLPDRDDFRLAGHLINVNYRGIPYSTLEPYAYLLDFDNALLGNRLLSSATYGARLQGAYDVISYAAKLLYAVEFAHQQDYGSDNPVELSVNYTMGELGFTKLIAHPWLEAVTVKVSYELLGGDGAVAVGAARVGRSFQTPLGTNHAFQGWADRFLTTPADGIADLYGTVAVKVLGANVMLSYHDFNSDEDNYDYGGEWDAQITRVFREHYTFGIKYARYEASGDALNLARNGRSSAGKQAYDLTRLWLWAELRF